MNVKKLPNIKISHAATLASRLSGTRKGKGFNFTLGSGSAQVTLESFQGTIQLVRPGSIRDHDRSRNDDRHKRERDD